MSRRKAPSQGDRHGSKGGHVVGVHQKRREEVAVPPLTETRTHRCPVCRNAVALTPRGYLWRHRDLFGTPCTNKATGERIELDELPSVAVPPAPVHPKPATHRPRPAPQPAVDAAERVRTPKAPSRLDVGSHCRVCEKWIPGEREICGRCYALGLKS